VRVASPQRGGAWWWCIRAHWRRSKPRRLPRPTSRTRRRWLSTSSGGRRAGLPVWPRRTLPWRTMPARGRAAAGAVHGGGGTIPYALVSSQRPGADATPAEDAPRRPMLRPSRPVIALSWRWSLGARGRKTLDERSWPRQCLPRCVPMPRGSKRIRSNTRPWSPASAGSSTPLPSAPCGRRSPNGSPRERC
jgi:hypothetical protein